MNASHAEIRTRAQPNCLLCGQAGRALYNGLQDLLFGAPGSWNIKQCPQPNCGLAWLDPMPTQDDVGRLYDDYFTHTPQPSVAAPARSPLRQEIGRALLASGFGYTGAAPRTWTAWVGRRLARSRFFRARAGSVIGWLPASWRGRLLDVGCGNGEFLARMRELGWDVVGFEPDRRAAAVARKVAGVSVFSGDLNDPGLSTASFDVVTMNNVIEHLAEPLPALTRIRDLLKSGGHLVVQTPNVSSLGHYWFGPKWRGLEPPRHFFLFTPAALVSLIGAAGLEVVKLENNAIGADFMWEQSSFRQRAISRRLFMLLEHVATGWPFLRRCGEQLAVIATKR